MIKNKKNNNKVYEQMYLLHKMMNERKTVVTVYMSQSIHV